MAKHQNNPRAHNKYKANNLKGYFDSQMEVFTHYLTEHTATCAMVSAETGIPEKNLTRYKKELEDKGLLRVLFVATCKHTRFKAGYLTTNPEIIQSLKGGKK